MGRTTDRPEQEYIEAHFSQGEIAEARQRLCSRCECTLECEGLTVRLLPITTKGADCPYFIPRRMPYAGEAVD